MSYMSPDEQQGVLIVLGTMANQIHALQEVVQSLQEQNLQYQAEIGRLSDELSHHSSEVVHGDIGPSDQDSGISSNGSSSQDRDSRGNSSVLSESTVEQQSLRSQMLRPRDGGSLR